MTNIKFIYFDAGDVLFFGLTDDTLWVNFLAEINITEDLLTKFNNLYDNYEPLFNVGAISVLEFQKIVEKELNYKFPQNYDLQEEMIKKFKPNYDMHKFVKTIAKKYRIGLLTNMYLNMLDEIIKNKLIPDMKWDVIIDSSVVHMAKPNNNIYKYAEEQANEPASTILFIDNSKKNIEAAKALDWNTFLFDQYNPKESLNKLRLLLQ